MSELPPLSFAAWLRYELIADVIKTIPTPASVLEVGAGQGALGARLASRFAYVGVEPDEPSAIVARQRVGPHDGTIVAALDDVVTSRKFDAVCAFEVLEHIADDRAALRAWAQRCRPGGTLLMSVPAHQHRMGRADILVGHYRRYERDQLRARVEEAGFTSVRIRTYGFPLGYALEAARHLVARHRTTATTTDHGSSEGGGGFLQPRDAAGELTRAVTAPFRTLQRPLMDTDLGVGYVLDARWASPEQGAESPGVR